MSKAPVRNNLVIELHIPDFEVAKSFYGILGFETVHENPVMGGAPGYLVLKRRDAQGDTILNFYGGSERVYGQEYFKKFPRDTKRGYAAEITIPVADVDMFYKTVQPRMQEHIMRPVMDKRDGDALWRDFRVEDPFGFLSALHRTYRLGAVRASERNIANTITARKRMV